MRQHSDHTQEKTSRQQNRQQFQLDNKKPDNRWSADPNDSRQNNSQTRQDNRSRHGGKARKSTSAKEARGPDSGQATDHTGQRPPRRSKVSIYSTAA